MVSEFSHVPVLFNECMEGLRIKPGGTYVDGTLGGGGHAAGIAERIGPEGLLIGIDRDRDALEAAGKKLEASLCRKILFAVIYGGHLCHLSEIIVAFFLYIFDPIDDRVRTFENFL